MQHGFGNNIRTHPTALLSAGGSNEIAEFFREPIVLRKTVAAMLAEGLGKFAAGLSAPQSAVPLHRVQVFIDAVMGQQPVALAGVAGQHPGLEVDDGGDIDHTIGGGRMCRICPWHRPGSI